MKSLKKEFFGNTMQIILVSLILIIIMTLVLVSICYSNRSDFLDFFLMKSIDLIYGMKYETDWISGYVLCWILLSILIILVVGIVYSLNLRANIVRPIEELKEAANNIVSDRLDIEITTSEYREMNELSVAFDEIRKKLLENKMREDELKKARKLLIANLSHDLNTPITSIKGYLEGIHDGVADTPEKKEKYLGTVYEKTILLEEIVKNMAKLTEIETGKMKYFYEYVDIISYIEHLCEIYECDAKEHGRIFKKEMKRKSITIMLDRNAMKRALDNIFSNSLKYTKKNDEIRVSLIEENQGILIKVSDTGKGIKKENIEKVFDTFYRGDAARSNIDGTGLGLGIAKEIVEAHGGKIWIKSQKYIGTEVFIYLHKK